MGELSCDPSQTVEARRSYIKSQSVDNSRLWLRGQPSHQAALQEIPFFAVCLAALIVFVLTAWLVVSLIAHGRHGGLHGTGRVVVAEPGSTTSCSVNATVDPAGGVAGDEIKVRYLIQFMCSAADALIVSQDVLEGSLKANPNTDYNHDLNHNPNPNSNPHPHPHATQLRPQP